MTCTRLLLGIVLIIGMPAASLDSIDFRLASTQGMNDPAGENPAPPVSHG